MPPAIRGRVPQFKASDGRSRLRLHEWAAVCAARHAGHGHAPQAGQWPGGTPCRQDGFRHLLAPRELSAMHEHAIGERVAGFAYVGLAGEPALGPVAFMHRPSAANDPLAPLGHHWQDASHESFGVVTAGLNSRTRRLEGSLFNPREADENHLVADFRGAKLDSYAARLSWVAWPARAGAAPYSLVGTGRLASACRAPRPGTRRRCARVAGVGAEVARADIRHT